jgi:hypothetical protein
MLRASADRGVLRKRRLPDPWSARERFWFRSLARQDLLNPGSGLIGRLEQGRVLHVALAEAGFQVPPPLVLKVMVRPVEADEHSGKLVICEDKLALTVMAVDEHAHRHE